MASAPVNVVVMTVANRRRTVTVFILLQLLSTVATAIVSSSSSAAVSSEQQSFSDEHLQPVSLEVEETEERRDLNETGSEGEHRALRGDNDSSSRRGLGLRGSVKEELAISGSGANSQEDANAMSGQGGWKNKQKYGNNSFAMNPSTFAMPSAIAVPSAFAMPTATMAMPTATMAMPTATMAMPTATMAMPTATMAMPTATMAMPTATMAMPTATMAMPTATMAMPTATMAIPTATMAMPTATMAMPASTMAMPASTMSMPMTKVKMSSSAVAMPSTAMAMPSTAMAMPASTMAMPASTMAMPASTMAVPYATMAIPAVAATPMAVENVGIPDGYMGGGIMQKIKAMKLYSALKKYAKYANTAGYNTYGTSIASAYPLYTFQAQAPAASVASYASYSGKGYNSYNGNNTYTGFAASTDNGGGLIGKKSRYTEEPGQRYLAQVISKNRTGWWISNKVSRLADVLGGVLPQGVDQPVLLSNGYENREATFLMVLQNRERFIDLLVQDQLLQEEQPLQRQWIGRMYTEVEGQYSAIQALDRDFAIAKMAPQGEALATFRHSLRLDIPVDLYEISGLGTYVQAPDGQVLLNAISRRPLIRATAEIVTTSVGLGKRAYKALLSLSQQAVRTVANLNCLSMVHTNINPTSFLVTEKGLVFLGGLFQATQRGNSLAENSQFTMTTPLFIPPELRDNTAFNAATAQPSQDSWQLGMTLFTFWCSDVTVDPSGGLNFNNCNSYMPAEIKDLISGLTQVDPNSRLLAENVALTHPAMLLAIYPDLAPQADVNQDDVPYL